jgi:hypothetical protein
VATAVLNPVPLTVVFIRLNFCHEIYISVNFEILFHIISYEIYFKNLQIIK